MVAHLGSGWDLSPSGSKNQKKTELKFDWESKRRSEKEGDDEERDDGGAGHEGLGSPSTRGRDKGKEEMRVRRVARSIG